jgi:hypothetical protein
MLRPPIYNALWVPDGETEWFSHYRPETREQAFRRAIKHNLRAIKKGTQLDCWHVVAELLEVVERCGQTQTTNAGELEMSVTYSYSIVTPTAADRALLPELA